MYEAALPPGGGGTLEERRAGYERMLALLPPAPGAQSGTFAIGGTECVDVDATGGAAVRTGVMLHGGGYVLGSASGYRSYASYLSAAARARVLVPEYRLAPEHPYPAAIEDALGAVKHAYEAVGPERAFVVGDSAGGGLALSTCLALRERGLPLPACVLLLSPLADVRAGSQTFVTNRDVDPVVTQRGIERAGQWYVGDAGPDQAPLAFPLETDLAGLPPVQILVGTAEVLLDDSRRLRQKLTAGGVALEYAEYPDMVHCWPLFSSFLPEGREALAAMGRFVDRHVMRPEDGERLPGATDLEHLIARPA
ncbi:alpha/beta hydrolase [Streptomyces canus]|uniref:alpha/beta hydrolase n=1 Tax=Streptomyces canus TaxID=58343 RepID=UPI0036A06D79